MAMAKTTEVNLDRSCTPIGRCIYCRRSGEEIPLSLEHAIPYALAGELRLPEASCDDCARIINGEFEQEYLSHEIVDARALLLLPSRSKGRRGRGAPHERPGRIGIQDETGLFSRWENVARADFPYALDFRIYEPPTFLTRKQAMAGIVMIANTLHFAPDFQQKISRIKGGVTMGTFEPSISVREIAKIAHGIAVSHFGLDGFEPFLVPLILGQDLLLNYFIGGTGSPVRSSELHAANITIRPDGVILLRLTLFATLNAPTYMAVVGRITPDRNNDTMAASAIDPQ